ncbi:MAG: CHAP domain-containing protein [Prevotellaceae bacterium]|nr:CHAP domain-containing protein [Prevotellaceae bacterium]
MKKKHYLYLAICLVIICLVGFWTYKNVIIKSNYTTGQIIDSINGIYVYYNGDIDNVSSRNITADGYNLGQKYQCVEFVKRYYYEYFNHRMPDSYGNAKDFFDPKLNDGQNNAKRNLVQYTNPSKTKPQKGDILIFDGTIFNKHGHIAIISKVTDAEIEIVQQNSGTKTRQKISFKKTDNKYKLNNNRVLGWLRKEK